MPQIVKNGMVRRRVVETRRIKTDARLVTAQRLECGHWQRFTGQKALDAKYVVTRFCKECTS